MVKVAAWPIKENNNMLRPATRFILAFALALCLYPCAQAQDKPTQAEVQVFFSPKGGCTEAIVKEIDAAKQTVLVQAYSFTSAPNAKEL